MAFISLGESLLQKVNMLLCDCCLTFISFRGQLVDVGNLAQGFTLGTRHLYQMGHLTVPVTLLSK